MASLDDQRRSFSNMLTGDGRQPVSTPRLDRGKALVVDDDTTNRLLLSRMLQREGFQTLEATCGEEALELFLAERPDIVFMDIMMPGMDGVEATARIKAMDGFDFVPVIFLTALQDQQTQMRCTRAGGDDFLSKPFSFTVLKARIMAMERVRDLQRMLVTKTQPLAEILEREHQEQALAERVFSAAIRNRNVAIDRLGVIQRPAAVFSGDLILTQRLPDGGLRILLGDFTGHGLAAAIGALPVADAFHAMTRKGVDDQDVLAELNRKLYQLLPADRFMAACMMSLSGTGGDLCWWNGGMPSAWLRSRTGLLELRSHALPLGILPDLPESSDQPHRIKLSAGDGLLMFSDGLVEARNQQDKLFEQAGFRQTLEQWEHARPVLPALIEALDAHCLAAEQSDDIAVVEIPVTADLFDSMFEVQSVVPIGGWSWSLELRDENLGSLCSVESLLRPLGLLDGLDAHLGALETIVSELYSNALEHGILHLPSSMKSTPEGFEAYYDRRTEVLGSGCKGRIGLDLTFQPVGSGGEIKVQISDDGKGFDELAWQTVVFDPSRPWGRGIALVRNLCDSLTYRNGGRLVEAVYRW